ncbi:MAG: lysophospholipid acyltransferase family protein [Pseudomonadota bacterium]
MPVTPAPNPLLTWLRSLIFEGFLILWSVLASLFFIPALLSARWTRSAMRVWVRGVLSALRSLAGLTHRIEGPRPQGQVLFAVQHQSAWETIAFHALVEDVRFVLKRELLWLPFVGWYIAASGMIPIDRGKSIASLRKIVARARTVKSEGASILIFPEGTRVRPGETRPYLPGVVALYQALDLPVVPVALNSGHFWGKNAVFKKPGVITVRFGEVIPPGMAKRDFLTTLETRIRATYETLSPPSAPPTKEPS